MIPARLLIPLLFTLAAPAAELSPAARQALSADFGERDHLPQSAVPEREWYAARWQGTWGPRPVLFPAPALPVGADPVEWKRARVVAAAQHFEGLPYQHHHIPGWAPPWPGPDGKPETAGLDCSNFTAWVYNYALGISFTSDLHRQADSADAPGRRLAAGEPFAPGDLLFICNLSNTEVTHVVLLVDESHVIDDHAQGVRIRPFAGWYRKSFSHARRIIE